MVDSANAAFWSSSLMWALLSFLVVMPALVMVNHASSRATRQTASTRQSPSPAEREQKSFVDEGSDEVRTLWPEPNQKDNEWPPQDVVNEERERVHA